MAKLNHHTSARIDLCITFAEKTTAEEYNATKQFQSWLLDRPSETQCELIELMFWVVMEQGFTEQLSRFWIDHVGFPFGSDHNGEKPAAMLAFIFSTD